MKKTEKINTDQPLAEYVQEQLTDQISGVKMYSGLEILDMIIIAQKQYMEQLKKDIENQTV